MNEQTLQGKWKEIKGDIQSAWGKLSGDDLEQSKGNMKSIAGLIQQKYGHKEDEVSSKLKDIYAKYESKAKDGAEQVTQKVANKTESVKNDMKNRNS